MLRVFPPCSILTVRIDTWNLLVCVLQSINVILFEAQCVPNWRSGSPLKPTPMSVCHEHALAFCITRLTCSFPIPDLKSAISPRSITFCLWAVVLRIARLGMRCVQGYCAFLLLYSPSGQTEGRHRETQGSSPPFPAHIFVSLFSQ